MVVLKIYLFVWKTKGYISDTVSSVPYFVCYLNAKMRIYEGRIHWGFSWTVERDTDMISDKGMILTKKQQNVKNLFI